MSDMSFTAVRARLMNPANSVPDTPIDLRPKRQRQERLPPMPLKITSIEPYKIPRRYPTLDDITRVVCEHYKVLPMDIESERREKAIVRPRQMWAYLARVMTPITFPQIGRYLGGRDHTTILHAYNKMKNLSEGSTDAAAEVAEVRLKVDVLFNSRNNLTCFDTREI